MFMAIVYVHPDLAARLLRLKDSGQRRAVAALLREVSANPSVLKPLKTLEHYTLLEAKPPHSLPYRLYFLYDVEKDVYVAVDWDTKDSQQRTIEKLYRKMRDLFLSV